MMNRYMCCGILLSLVVTSAHAAVSNPTSRKYFDESGSLVGQSIRLCSNQFFTGGNTHTAYFIEETMQCSTQVKGVEPREVVPIVDGTKVTRYVLPGFLDITTACQIARCVPAAFSQVDVLWDKGWTPVEGPSR